MKMNFFLRVGLLIIAFALAADHLFQLNEFMSGFLLGLGITFELIGMLAMKFNIDICKIKNKMLGFFS
jgi:NO-binding membrane sensor protein with MHYT domain